MDGRILITAMIAGGLLVAAGHGAEPPAATSRGFEHCRTLDDVTGEALIDPDCFLDALVERYHRLTVYEDIARVVRITQRLGEAPQRVETSIGCEIEGDALRIETPTSQVRRSMGLGLRPRLSPELSAAHRRYQLWLAPHMALRFGEAQDRDDEAGEDVGFVATEVERVTIDDRPLVHLEIRSDDRADERAETTYDLYVNPESMLVERIEGQQRLPDGVQYETSLEITTLAVESDWTSPAPPDEPAVPVVEPPALPAYPQGPAADGPAPDAPLPDPPVPDVTEPMPPPGAGPLLR